MVGPVERESCQTILNILVVWAKVVRCEAGRDDEVPEEHGDGQHEVHFPDDVGEDNFCGHDQQLSTRVFLFCEHCDCCNQEEEGEKNSSPDVGDGESVELAALKNQN